MFCLFVRAINNKTARTCNACELNMIRINCQARLLIISAEISKFNPQSQFRSKRSRADTLGLIWRKQPVSHKVAFYFPTKPYCLLQTKSKVSMLKSQCTIKPASHPPTYHPTKYEQLLIANSKSKNMIIPGVVILHIENKSAPLHEQKIINLPQNRTMNFQKFPYF